MFTKLFSRGRTSRTRRRPSATQSNARQSQRFRPALEGLETRDCPSCTISVINRVLTVNCDNSPNNVVTVSHGFNQFFSWADINGVQTLDGFYDSIRINGGSGGTTSDIHSMVRPLDIHEGNGTETVNLSPYWHRLNDLQANVTIAGGNGTDTLNVHDEAAGPNYTYTLTATSVTRTGGAPLITYSILQNFMSLLGGSGANTYNINGTGAIGLTTVNTGGGVDTVNIHATVDTLAVNTTTGSGGGNSDVINLGNLGSLANIRGPVTIFNGLSHDHLNIDNSADTTNHPNVIISNSGITGLAPGALNFSWSSISTLSISGGRGNNTYTISGTPAFTSMDLYTGQGMDTVNVQTVGVPLSIAGSGGGGNDVVNIGNAGSLAGITASVLVWNNPGTDHLNIDNSVDSTNHPNVVISNSGITGLAPGALNFGSSSISALSIGGGRGNNTYTISGTPVVSFGSMTLNTGSGADTVRVQANSALLTVDTLSGSGNSRSNIPIGNAGSLAGIGAPVTIHNVPSYDTVTIDDSADSASHSAVMISSNGVAGLAPNPINFTNDSVNALTINGGTGNNIYTLTDTPVAPIGSMTLNTGSGSDTVNPLRTSVPLTVNGSGGSDILVGAATSNRWEVTGADAGVLTSSAFRVPVTFTGFQNLSASGGPDYFLFDDGARLDGAITGSGADTLDYTPYTSSVIVDLQTASATGVGGSVSGILSVTGGSGAPASSGVYNLLIGNGGNTLTGGTGRRNILVAGGNASTLNAGDNEDLLIGGTTIYDTDPALASWLQIAAYWAGTDDYFTRMGNLTSGNGVPLLDASTVTGNGGGNTMNGNGALALIYTDGNDNVSNFDPNSIIVPITP